MKSDLEQVDKIWLRCRNSFLICLILWPLIVGIYLAIGPEIGSRTALELIGGGLLLLGAGGLLLCLTWLMCRFVRFAIEMRDQSR